MSILVIQIPPRPRLRAQGQGAASFESARTGVEYVYATSPDGLVLQSHGQAAASLLPKADTVVAMLADTDVSWHRITLPKAPTARLRAALIGVLEEAMLEDIEGAHFAVAPMASAGQRTWVAAVNRQWLRAELAALERANVFVDRVVPAAWPDDPPTGHFSDVDEQSEHAASGIALTWSHPDGVAAFRLQGGLARALIPLPPPQGTRWSATPAAATAAERWLGMPVNVMAPPHRLLQASRTLWNLRQFDLARHNRGARALRDALRQFASSSWRPARYGLVALVIAQIVGLNLWALNLNSAIASKQDAMTSVVKTAFPNVRSVLDAPLQMQREMQMLRAQAGQPDETDFEPMLQAAAMSWPSGQGPVNNVQYEPGKLTLAITGWGDPQIAQFRSQLQPAGWDVNAGNDGRATITRAPAGATP